MRSPLASLATLVLFASVANAQGVIHVPGDRPTIQAGIAAASTGDLVLVAPGVYREQIDFLGKRITVASSGGAGVTKILGTGAPTAYTVPDVAVVSFVNGEGPGTVLQGFTISGHDATLPGVNAPVWSTAAPTILGCRIVKNTGGLAGGFHGSGTLVGCDISNNVSFGEGGGVVGDALLVDCTLTRNRSTSSHGSAVFAWPGCRLERCSVIANDATGDGHSGAIFGPAVVIDTLVARNVGDEFGGQNTGGAVAIDGALLVDGCTVSANVFLGAGGFAVRAQEVKNSILGGDRVGFGELAPGAVVSFSDVQGGVGGTGNISGDPQFVDPSTLDFHLRRTSPAIDAGDPASPADPDGTVRDMGAFFVPQYRANLALRFGTTPAVDLTANAFPVIGTTVAFTLAVPGAHTSTVLFGYRNPSSPIQTPFGELLVDPTSPRVLLHSAIPSGGFSTHAFPIPADPALIGETLTVQGARFGAGIGLSANALDLLLGL